MAFSAKRIEFDRDDVPEKIIIATGLSFGDAFKFVLLGALVGAGATYQLLQNRLSSPADAEDAVTKGLSGGGAKSTPKSSPQSVVARLSSLSSRAATVAKHTAGVARFATETVRPAVTEAVREGRKTAQEVQAELQRDIESARENDKEQ